MRIKEMPQGSGGLLVKVAYWFSLRWFGKIVDPVKVMCHHLWVLLGSVAFEIAFGRAKEIDTRLKLLAQIKVAAMIGCPW
jgi:hypothetical protein